jgi:epoxide hydrolase-like predicted phosphatase
MIRALIFDSFGLFYTDPVLAYTHDPSTPPPIAIALDSLEEQGDLGKISKNEFVAQAASLLSISLADAEQRFFHSDMHNEQVVLFVQQLRKNYKVAMLSNIGGDMMDGFFSPRQRRQLFDEVVLSGDVHLAKPDKAIFELICQRLGVKLREAVMIDDRRSNCDMAKSIGMRSICYQSFEQLSSELVALTK